MLGLWYKKELRIVCDTSFLIGLMEYKAYEKLIERFGPVKLLIPETVLRELYKLKSAGGKVSIKASLTIQVIDMHPDLFKVINSILGVPDEDVIALAMKHGYVVATLDKKVRRKAVELGLRVLMLKNSEPYIN